MGDRAGGTGRGGGGGRGPLFTAENWREMGVDNESPVVAAADARIAQLNRAGVTSDELDRLVEDVAVRNSEISGVRRVLRELERNERLRTSWRMGGYNISNSVQRWGMGRPSSAAEAQASALRRLNQLWTARL